MTISRYAFLMSGIALWPRAALCQSNAAWLFQAQAGYHDIHHDETGLALGVGFARQIKWLRLGVGFTQTVPLDHFTAMELMLEIHPAWHGRFSPFVGGGAGGMFEQDFGAFSFPYFGGGGLEFRVQSKMRLRVAAWFGKHMNAGDPGTFAGPDTYMGGIVYQLGT